jgi:membrane-associated phospholipid phosphatase
LKPIGVWLAIVLGFLDLALTLTVHLRVWQPLDWQFVVALQAALPRAVDVPFSFLSLIGAVEVTGLILLVIVFYARPARRVPLILAFGSATIIELIGKTIVYQPTTPAYLLRYIPLFPILSAEVNPGFSFPSGHAVRTTFIVIVLIAMLAASSLHRAMKIALGTLLFALEIVMLVSRVYLAEHWLTDVIGGALLGAAFALIALSSETNLHIPFLQKQL